MGKKQFHYTYIEVGDRQKADRTSKVYDIIFADIFNNPEFVKEIKNLSDKNGNSKS